jgi:carbamoylphosphate synthase large subunit
MPKLLMIGGNRSTVGSIRALRAAGFEVAVAEKLPRQYALPEADFPIEIAPTDVAGLRAAIATLGGVNGIIGINEVAMASAAVLQRELGLPGLSPKVIWRTTSKLAQRQCWAGDTGLHVPFRAVQTRPDLLNAVAAIGGYPVVVKPDLSQGGSRGVSLVTQDRDLDAAFDFAEAHRLSGSAIVVERALEGPQFSAELMTRNGRTCVLAIGRKIKSKEPYRVDLAISYPGITDAATWTAIETMCARAKALLGITRGPGHIEFTLTPGGPRPIELAARCGGSLTADLAAYVSGYHPVVEAGKLACDVPTGEWTNITRRGAVLLFLAYEPCMARELHIPEDLARDPSILDLDVRLPDDGLIQPLQWTSQRIGYLGVTAEDGAAALARAMRVAESIRLETRQGVLMRPLAVEAGVPA